VCACLKYCYLESPEHHPRRTYGLPTRTEWADGDGAIIVGLDLIDRTGDPFTRHTQVPSTFAGASADRQVGGDGGI
jgi:hypothetical protein